ncbi:A-kinase anchor protein 5 [Pleuronectes platessa]|uniref:A-kinase anchor protein 5 n=1 Tax=Pleuronectes platessa TaxID=8262 RepID=UPI00232A3D73|nr:A-kinase anchor protein 5 [Pleuronectes platessa]
MRRIVVLAILSFITWMSSVHAIHGPVSGCCLGVSNTRVPLWKIKNYTIQFEGVCPFTAIVFQTELGNRICKDPQSDWAKKAKMKVDEAKRLLEMEQNKKASTRDFASTVPSTTKKVTVKVDEEAKGFVEMEQNTQASTSDPQSDLTEKVTVKVDEAKGLLEIEQNTQASTSDPQSDWAEKVTVKVDEAKGLLEIEQNTQASTSNPQSDWAEKVTLKVDEAKGLLEIEQNTQASTSDPQSDWAEKVTVKVDEEAKGFLQMEQNTESSTSDFASTVPSTTKAPVKQGRKRRRRRWRLKSRSGRIGKCF